LTDLYQKCQRVQDYKACLAVRKELSLLLGLHESEATREKEEVLGALLRERLAHSRLLNPTLAQAQRRVNQHPAALVARLQEKLPADVYEQLLDLLTAPPRHEADQADPGE